MNLNSKTEVKKILIIRLSSMGDVVLSSSALSAISEKEIKVDWLVAQPWNELLAGHPKISKLWVWNKSKNFNAWRKFCKELLAHEYDEIVDLQGGFRTFFLRIQNYFSNKRTPWQTLSKSRLSRLGFFIFKMNWAKKLRPAPRRKVFARAVGGTGEEKPNLRHLIYPTKENYQLKLPGNFIGAMASSRWPSKELPTAIFGQWLLDFLAQRQWIGTPIAVLGSVKDQKSHELIAWLELKNIEHINFVGSLSLHDLAYVLSKAKRVFSVDTGIAHLAEAVGTPVSVYFGPTHPNLGFGPWGSLSEAWGAPVFCRPCSKDGKRCYRVWDTYACLNQSDSKKWSRLDADRNAGSD